MRIFKSLSILMLAVLILAACSSQQEKLKTEIKSMEDVLFADANKMIDKAKARELLINIFNLLMNIRKARMHHKCYFKLAIWL